MFKQTAILLAIGALICVGCVPEGDQTIPTPTPTPTTQAKPPKPLPDNYADPLKPTMVPYYDLPAGWEVSPSSKTMLRSWEGRPHMANLWIDLFTVNYSDVSTAAAERLEKITCVDGHSPYSIWLQCDRSIEQSQEKIDGQTVPHLRYYGTWQGEDRQVDEYFFVYQEKVYFITLEGGTEEDWQTVKDIIETLEFRYEVFVPGPEDEERGAL